MHTDNLTTLYETKSNAELIFIAANKKGSYTQEAAVKAVSILSARYGRSLTLGEMWQEEVNRSPELADAPNPVRCVNHPNMDAVGACDSCGRLVCPECKGDVSGKICCPQCSTSIPRQAKADIKWGIILLLGGAVITLATWATAKPGGTYYVMWGAIAFGLIYLFRGLFKD